MTKHGTKPNPEKPKTTRYHRKKPAHHRNQCRQLRIDKDRNEGTKKSAGNNNSDQTNSNPNNNKNANFSNNSNTSKRKERKPRNVYSLCGTCVKTDHSTKNSYFEVNAAIRRPHGNEDRQDRTRPTKRHAKKCKGEYSSCCPRFNLETPCPHSGNALDKPATTKPIWLQTLETSLKQHKLDNIFEYFADHKLLKRLRNLKTCSSLKQRAKCCHQRDSNVKTPVQLRNGPEKAELRTG